MVRRTESTGVSQYTKDVGPDLVATTLARGRLEEKQLMDVKDILICDSWAGDGGSGSRLA